MDQTESDQVSLILRGVLSLGRRLRAERPQSRFSLSAIGALASLHRNGALTAARLAAIEHLQPQSLTRIIASLERQGCIARKRSVADRRQILIELTAKGRKVLLDDMRGRARWLGQAMAAGLSQPERQALGNAAGAMLKLAEYGAADPSSESPP